jgi:hypothetical protein
MDIRMVLSKCLRFFLAVFKRQVWRGKCFSVQPEDLGSVCVLFQSQLPAVLNWIVFIIFLSPPLLLDGIFR